MGKCEYVLAKDSEEKFMVLQNNEACGNRNAACTSAVTVKIQGITIHQVRGESVLVNGRNVKLPYEEKGTHWDRMLKVFNCLIISQAIRPSPLLCQC